MASQSQSTWYDSRALESAWQLLPGGPDICSEPDGYPGGECWQYMGSQWDGRQATHEFRHRAHPHYGSRRVYAYVTESDTGVRLAEVRVKG